MTCKRCNMLMYAGPKKAEGNHKRGVCSDGCPTKMKPVKNESQQPLTHQDTPPPYPHFTHGKYFHPIRFLETLQDLYNRAVTHG